MKALLMLLLFSANAMAAGTSGYGLAVLVGDEPRPEYMARGTVYVEAIRGADFSLRLSNPTPYRVGVALSVDGLNTIDARHTDPRDAEKWVLEPYQSIVIPGWQVNQGSARSFFFTGEKDSYGAALGQTNNLGVIEAVFFREKHRSITVVAPRMEGSAKEAQRSAVSAAPSDDYAATGMGDKLRNEIHVVDIDLEKQPVASVRIRYEFTPQLIKLGVLPRFESPLERRERAKGFERFCPEPK